MNTITWNWELLDKNSYCIRMRLYNRYFVLTVTWNNLWRRWQVFLYETNKLYDSQFNVERWHPIELPAAIDKTSTKETKKNAFRKAVTLICDLYEDESTRIIENIHTLH